MDSWLKGLIAAACVVVIAGGGYYAWGEYQIRSAQAERSAGIERARAEIFKFADAKPHEIDKARDYCRVLNQVNTNNPEKSDVRETILRNCRYFGYL